MDKGKRIGILQRLQKISVLCLACVMLILYIPQIEFYDLELPELIEWEAEGELGIKIRLPEEFHETQVLCFWSNHQQLEVYLENEKIYEDSSKEKSFCDIPASHWNRIEFPEGCAGKEVHIYSKSTNAPYIQSCVYGSDGEINQWLNQRFGRLQLIDVGMIGVGICFILYAVFNGKKTDSREWPLYLGQTLVLIGFFFRSSLKGLPMNHVSEMTREIISYFTFFSLTIPLFVYIRKKLKIGKIYEGICSSMIIIQMILVSIAFVLHGLKVVDISKFVWLGGMFWIIYILLTFVGALLKLRERRSWVTVLSLISSVILLFMIPLEILGTTVGLPYVVESGMILRGSILAVVILEILAYSQNIQELEVQKGKTEEENRKLQLQLLASQIRPHFVLNTLGAIRSMIMQDAKKASDLLYDFSKYLRKNIEEKDYTKPIPFLEELDYIETYLRLEQTRFGNRLKVEYFIDKKDFGVLPLTIQPFVENAVKHGLFPKKHGGVLQIRTYENEEQIFLEIQDNGVGFDVGNLPSIMKEKKSVGLRSAIYRIEEDMRGKCNIISKEKEDSGTFVQIILQKQEGK